MSCVILACVAVLVDRVYCGNGCQSFGGVRICYGLRVVRADRIELEGGRTQIRAAASSLRVKNMHSSREEGGLIMIQFFFSYIHLSSPLCHPIIPYFFFICTLAGVLCTETLPRYLLSVYPYRISFCHANNPPKI